MNSHKDMAPFMLVMFLLTLNLIVFKASKTLDGHVFVTIYVLRKIT